MSTGRKVHTVEELLEIGKNERWNEAPGWQESTRHHLSDLKQAKKMKLISLLGGVLLVVMSLVATIFGVVNWRNGHADFPLVFPLVLLTAFWAAFWVWQTRKLLSAISKIDELTDQLMRVGINFDVHLYQNQKTQDLPPHSC